eukprot:NODE_2603_length_2182_cov_7.339173.p1 GENE.NODE_2603_length_2182_cov_7.339173~~NODE_2603_length_2182_cov_7.339173.p1  ORF type:complete len:644 (+),score=167.04 NODE_2603_length_2182_cov_7.339173:86-2017(+)
MSGMPSIVARVRVLASDTGVVCHRLVSSGHTLQPASFVRPTALRWPSRALTQLAGLRAFDLRQVRAVASNAGAGDTLEGLDAPPGCEFRVLRQESDGHGGGLIVFEVTDALRPGRALKAEAVVIGHAPQSWKKARGLPARGATACVSSQAGCPLDCSFCDSGLVKRAANLPAWAIVAQVLAAQRLNPNVRRVVFMGMGEPLLNYRQVSAAIRELQLHDELRRPWAITVSTVGVAPRIARLAADHPGVALAVSLHAPNQALRAKLVPMGAARWPLEDIMAAVRAHEESSGRTAMMAYVVLAGLNDGREHAQQLAELLSGDVAPRPLVNLIPYNPTSAGERHGFKMPSRAQVMAFRTALRARGVRATVRWSTAEGRPLRAACGQLNTDARGETSDGDVMADVEGAVALQKDELDVEGRLPEEATVPPRVITRRLSQAKSVDRLLELVEAHADELNAIHISAAFVTLARSAAGVGGRLHSDERFKVLLERALAVLPTCEAQACANVFWALGKIRYRPNKQFLAAIVAASRRTLPEFWPQNLANVLWACGAMRFRVGHGFLRELEEAVLPKVPALTALEVSNSLLALAKLARQHKPLPALLQAMLCEAEKKAASLKPQDASNLLQACAVFQLEPSDSLRQALDPAGM